jgi:glycosyltransferase involved in cell wall biosynthesis
MRSYQKEDIIAIYGLLMKRAHRYAGKGKWLKALADLESAATWAYSFNWIYTDRDADSLLKSIAVKTIPQSEINNVVPRRCVLVDSFCMDNKGLTQQYMRAMIHNQMEILYICTSKILDNGTDILKELRNYSKAELLLFNQTDGDRVKMALKIAQAIKDYSPSSVFLHIAPWDTTALMACCSVKGAIIYNINLTDHAYWLGASFLDYNLEFRPYGMTVSLERRGLKSEQLLPLPFYSIKPLSKVFIGFPPMPENAVKIFTGGALYKMLGKNDVFFHMMERLLSISPDVYILVAGFEPNKLFSEKCAQLTGHNRILLIGPRKDIDAVFENCDIYLSTYPISGGLMTQYAAAHGKPILAYRTKDDSENAIEELLNHYQDEFHSFTDMDAMCEYAERLVENEKYRIDEGKSLQNGMMTPERFADAFSKLIVSGQNQWNWTKDQIDYDAFTDHYIELENQNGFSATSSLVRAQKLSLFLKLPGYRENILFALLDILKNLSMKRQVRKIVKKVC